MDREDVEETVQAFDQDGNGEIDYIEFVAIMASGDPAVTKMVTSHISNFREVFDLFDRDNDGSIKFAEYQEGLQLLRVSPTHSCSNQSEFVSFVQLLQLLSVLGAAERFSLYYLHVI